MAKIDVDQVEAITTNEVAVDNLKVCFSIVSNTTLDPNELKGSYSYHAMHLSQMKSDILTAIRILIEKLEQ